MFGLFSLAVLAALLSGCLCGAIGFHIQRFGVTTLSFGIAHAALAGAALGVLWNLDPTYSAMATAVSSALVLGWLFTRVEYGRELICMAVFSASSAIALLAVYLSTARVLATTSVAEVLWGSLLAVTAPKVLVLLVVVVLFLIYIAACRMHIDAILYDRRLAEAEGVDVQMHTLILLFFAGVAIASTLKLTGGFLVFTLIYNPVASAMQLARNAKLQLLLSLLLGASSSVLGLALSYLMDLPVGASIALLSSLILLLSYGVRVVVEGRKLREASRLV